MDFLDAINWSIVSALAVVIVLVSYLRWVKPKIKNKKGLYNQVILALSIVGAVYKDEQVKKLVDVVKDVVEDVQDLGKEINEMKILETAREVVYTLQIDVEDETLKLIVNVVIYYLGYTDC